MQAVYYPPITFLAASTISCHLSLSSLSSTFKPSAYFSKFDLIMSIHLCSDHPLFPFIVPAIIFFYRLVRSSDTSRLLRTFSCYKLLQVYLINFSISSHCVFSIFYINDHRYVAKLFFQGSAISYHCTLRNRSRFMSIKQNWQQIPQIKRQPFTIFNKNVEINNNQ